MAPPSLSPDETVLRTIFPHAQPGSIDVLVDSANFCTFRATFDSEPFPGAPLDLVVRLEDCCDGTLQAVASLQKLAYLQVPDLVPQTYFVGKTNTADNRSIEYSITQFIPQTVTLDSVWNDLDETQQGQMMDSIVNVVEQLRNLDRSSDQAALIQANTNLRTHRIGGPKLGYFQDLKSFLAKLVQDQLLKSLPTSSLTAATGGDGIMIESTIPELGHVHLTSTDLDSLESKIGFSHNDIEPRNILVRKLQSTDGCDKPVSYVLAAFIDWEMGGFVPFAFETGWKDMLIGPSGRYYSWYQLFKAKTLHLLGEDDSDAKLIRAIHIIMQSTIQKRKKNVRDEIHRRWIAMEKLALDKNIRVGWTRQEDIEDGWKPKPYTVDDENRMIQQILKDFGRA